MEEKCSGSILKKKEDVQRNLRGIELMNHNEVM